MELNIVGAVEMDAMMGRWCFVPQECLKSTPVHLLHIQQSHQLALVLLGRSGTVIGAPNLTTNGESNGEIGSREFAGYAL